MILNTGLTEAAYWQWGLIYDATAVIAGKAIFESDAPERPPTPIKKKNFELALDTILQLLFIETRRWSDPQHSAHSGVLLGQSLHTSPEQKLDIDFLGKSRKVRDMPDHAPADYNLELIQTTVP